MRPISNQGLAAEEPIPLLSVRSSATLKQDIPESGDLDEEQSPGSSEPKSPNGDQPPKSTSTLIKSITAFHSIFSLFSVHDSSMPRPLRSLLL